MGCQSNRTGRTARLRENSDDNALNRAEALDQAPGLQVADESIISNILTDPRFQGKDDHGLTRLRQYQLLQTRAADQESAKGDNVAFLRASNIKVDIIYDVAAHIDRAVELVNRTNQLNFTKKRLSEDTEEARQQLLTALQPFYVWSGLVRVRDRYGDYGIVGFYMGGGFREKRRLTHFCFSCRTLGMGIERWVYDQIGRPELHVVGEVLTNFSDDVVVDWINASDAAGGELPGTSKLFDTKVRLRLRGGCDLDAVAHYAGTEGYTLTSEVNFGWHGLFVRHDNSSNLVLSLLAGDAQRQALKELDLDQLFRTATFDRCGQRTLTVLSMWSDRLSWRWRHRRLGFTITLDVPRLDLFALHRTLRKDPATDLTPFFLKQNIDQTHFWFLDRLICRLSLDFDADNSLDEATYKDKLHTIFNYSSPDNQIAFILLPRHLMCNDDKLVISPRQEDNRRWSREASDIYSNVHVVDFELCISNDSEIHRHLHFDRRVYFRLYERIRDLCSQVMSVRDEATQPLRNSHARAVGSRSYPLAPNW